MCWMYWLALSAGLASVALIVSLMFILALSDRHSTYQQSRQVVLVGLECVIITEMRDRSPASVSIGKEGWLCCYG